MGKYGLYLILYTIMKGGFGVTQLEQAVFLVQAQHVMVLFSLILWLVVSLDIIISPGKRKVFKYALFIAVIAVTAVRMVFEILAGLPIIGSILIIVGVIISTILVKRFPQN